MFTYIAWNFNVLLFKKTKKTKQKLKFDTLLVYLQISILKQKSK